MTSNILKIISILVGIVGLIMSYMNLYKAIRTQKELSPKLRVEFEKLFARKNLLVPGMDKVRINKAQWSELIGDIRQVVQELPSDKKDGMLEPFNQKSYRGQLNYLNRLLHIGGSNVKILVQR